jgi:hypothetical protein
MAEISEPSYLRTSTWLVVSAEDRDNPKLLVSNMTVDDWKAERGRIALEFSDLVISEHGEDDSLLAASDVPEGFIQWKDDSDIDPSDDSGTNLSGG